MTASRLVCTLAVCFALVLTTAGCSSQQNATFIGYEYKQNNKAGGYQTLAEILAGQEPTGRATVKLDNGQQVIANCPFQQVKPKQKIVVQQNDNGSWVVVSVQ